MIRILTVLALAAVLVTCGGQQARIERSAGSYMGHNWSIDDNRLLHWDGEPYIRYGTTGNGDVQKMMDLGFRQFNVWPSEDKFVFSGNAAERRQSVAGVASFARRLDSLGATYYAGLNSLWPWRAWGDAPSRIAPEDHLTYVITAAGHGEQARTDGGGLRLLSAPIEDTPGVLLGAVGPGDVTVYRRQPGAEHVDTVSDVVRSVEVVRPDDMEGEDAARALRLRVTLDGAKLEVEPESLLIAHIRIKSSHSLTCGLPALWRKGVAEYYQKSLEQIAPAYKTDALRGLMFGDEIATFPRAIWAPVYPDFGADAVAMKQYRAWLASRYDSIEDVSASFGIEFDAFGQVPWYVLPAREPELMEGYTGPFPSRRHLMVVSETQDEFRCWLYGHWLAEYGRMAKEEIGDVPVFVTAPDICEPADTYLGIEKWALIEGLDGLVRNQYGDVDKLESGRYVALRGWGRGICKLGSVTQMLKEIEQHTGRTKAYWCNEFGLVPRERPMTDDRPLADDRELDEEGGEEPEGEQEEEPEEEEWGGFGYEFRFDSKEKLRDYLYMLVDYGCRGMNRFLMAPRPGASEPGKEIRWLSELHDDVVERILNAGEPLPDLTEGQAEQYWRGRGPAMELAAKQALRVVTNDERFGQLPEHLPGLSLHAEYSREYGCWIVGFVAGEKELGVATVGEGGKILEWDVEAGE